MSIQVIPFVIFVTVFASTLASSPYQTCHADLGVATDVVVSGCSSSPCILVRGGDIRITVNFTANADVPKVTDAVFGIISRIPVPFPTKHPDACTTKGLTCPLQKGQHYTYHSVTPVHRQYPQLRLIVRWAIKDDAGKFVFCVEIPAEIR